MNSTGPSALRRYLDALESLRMVDVRADRLAQFRPPSDEMLEAFAQSRTEAETRERQAFVILVGAVTEIVCMAMGLPYILPKRADYNADTGGDEQPKRDL